MHDIYWVQVGKIVIFSSVCNLCHDSISANFYHETVFVEVSKIGKIQNFVALKEKVPYAILLIFY